MKIQKKKKKRRTMKKLKANNTKIAKTLNVLLLYSRNNKLILKRNMRV